MAGEVQVSSCCMKLHRNSRVAKVLRQTRRAENGFEWWIQTRYSCRCRAPKRVGDLPIVAIDEAGRTYRIVDEPFV